MSAGAGYSQSSLLDEIATVRAADSLAGDALMEGLDGRAYVEDDRYRGWSMLSQAGKGTFDVLFASVWAPKVKDSQTHKLIKGVDVPRAGEVLSRDALMDRHTILYNVTEAASEAWHHVTDNWKWYAGGAVGLVLLAIWLGRE